MPPVGNVTCSPHNATTQDPGNIGKDDLNALLYIVVTLLFYSMGIIIGIITYLKREQADMEEDKMFDMYMQLKREPFNLYKKERVRQMALYLKQLEEQSAAREKIENWKTIEHSQLQAHIQRYQPCRQHAHRHFSCADCNRTSPIPEVCQGYDERTTLAISEGNWAENGGGTALLCSLTLGVCEPLLTPESMKRLAFSDLTNVEGKSSSTVTLGSSAVQPFPCMPVKSALRHSSLTVHYADKPTAMPKDEHTDQNSGNELKQYFMNAKPTETDIDNPALFENSGIELKSMRQCNYDEGKTVFQKSYALTKPNRNCDNVHFDIQTIPSYNKRRSSLTTTSGKCPKLFRQLSHDPDHRPFNLAVHAPLGKNYRVNADVNSNNENIYTSVDRPLREYGLLTSPPVELSSTGEKKLADSRLSCNIAAAHNDGTVHLLYNQDKHQGQEHHYLQQQYPEIPLLLPQTGSWCSPQKTDLPLQLFVLAQEQSQPGDLRPKVFFPVPCIPHSLIRKESVNLCVGSTAGSLPQTTQRDCSPIYDTSKQDISQSVQISDVTTARKLGLNWKSKTVDKKSAPRTQPERRGALFFTQRSLHKDADSPKPVSDRKHSRPTFLSHQESIDSHNSRTSDLSEGIDTPLLNRTNEIENDINISSISLTVGPNSISPPATCKHTRRIPNLTRTQSVDTSKLLEH